MLSLDPLSESVEPLDADTSRKVTEDLCLGNVCDPESRKLNVGAELAVEPNVNSGAWG